MRQKSQIANDLESTLTAEALTATFEEIAALKMRAIRQSVEQTRLFLNDIDTVYRQIKHDYAKWLALQGKNASQSAIKKNGKTVYVIITENGGLYGDLPIRIIKKFIETYQGHIKDDTAKDVAVVVIGAVGGYLLQANYPKLNPKVFTIDDNKPEPQLVDQVITLISPYSSIYIVYGYFASLLSIVPQIVSISGDITATQTDLLFSEEQIHPTVYEPSIEKVAQFFETEILKALFQQKLFEMQLARAATRMVAMDTATQKTQERLKELSGEAIKLNKRIANKKLQEIFAGSSIW